MSFIAPKERRVRVRVPYEVHGAVVSNAFVAPFIDLIDHFHRIFALEPCVKRGNTTETEAKIHTWQVLDRESLGPCEYLPVPSKHLS